MIGAAERVARRAEPAAAPAILQPGRNCWRIDPAGRFYCVQDAADYFRLVRQALLSARKTVFTLGWDTTAHTDLLPGEPADGAPTRLDKLLAFIAKRRPQLRCYILTWDYGSLYTLERDPFTRWRLGWRMPRNVRFGFDDHHPVGASHHQKIIVVDDQLAFCGGIDLTGHRWDTCAHRPDEPLRVTPQGKHYEPYHEVQAMLSGRAAASLGELARDRWRALGAERLPPVAASSEDLWPDSVTADLTDVDVAISRTMPGSDTQPAVRECEALFLDSIALAKRAIYIESQYFTNEKIAAALAARLAEPDGPEIIVVTPKECHGWIEKSTMGAFRDGVLRQMLAADTHAKLRLVYPAASRSRGIPTFIHSKVMVVDDEFVRIGSANCSHRSMGVDTECDVAVEAHGDDSVRAGIRRIRDRLLGEHLGVAADVVANDVERAGSLRAVVDARQDADHTLLRIELPAEPEEPPSAALRAAADPDEPINLGASVDQLIPAVDASSERSPLRIWILPAIVLAAAAGVAWTASARLGRTGQAFQDLLTTVPGLPASVWLGVAIFLMTGLLLVPLEVLAVAAGLFFGPVRGGIVALTGSVAAAVVGYGFGRLIGPSGLSRWMSGRSYRSIRQLRTQGFIGIVALRLASVASAGSIHLLCGAWRVPFTTYLAGSAIGLVPAIAALCGFGGLLRQAFLEPTLWNGLMAMGAGVALIAVAAALRTFLLLRQFAPSVTSHRERAEFG